MSHASVCGVEAAEVAEPTETRQLGEVLARAARDRACVSLVGGGSKLGLGRAPERVDLLVRTRGMARILDYAPADMVITAEAGATLAAVQAAAREHRQRLAIDPPFSSVATVGGLLATADCGPLRARYGAIKDLVIGATLVRADGAVARSGGKVVKNVAGFDLPKLVCGSLGTLAAVATATFRLHPLPEAGATVRVGGLALGEVHALLLRIAEAQLEPASAVALHDAVPPGAHPSSTWELAVRFEGFAAGVRDQCARLVRLVGDRPGGPAEVQGEEAARALRARHDRVREEGPVRIKVACPPSRLGALEPALLALGSDWSVYPSLGLAHLRADAPEPARIAAARAALSTVGGSLVVWEMPAALRAACDPWGEPPSTHALMQRLKASFDPDRRLNRGRFVGGL